MRNFDAGIAARYRFIKDCPEHQIVTWLESNGIDARPAFHRQLIDSLSFLNACLSAGEYRAAYLDMDIWGELRFTIGLTNREYNTLREGVGIGDMIDRHGLPIMLSCDSYHLPYSQNYNRKHAGTRVIILDVDRTDNRYLIGEAPFQICEWVDCNGIEQAHVAEQPARGYCHVPRLPEQEREPAERDRLLLRLQEALTAAVSAGATNVGSLSATIAASTVIRQPSALAFVLECFMHLQAGWMKLCLFMEWLEEESGAAIPETIADAMKQQVNAWQRMQLEYVKLQRKSESIAPRLLEKLIAIREQELLTYSMLNRHLKKSRSL